MKLLEKNSNYVSYEQVNDQYKRIYTMVNVGDYTGFLYREFDEKASEDYILLFEEAYKEDKKIFHVESFISENGTYLRFIIETYNAERVICTDGIHILSDTFFVSPNKNEIRAVSKAYNSDGIMDDMLLSDYLKTNPSFVSIDGDEYKSNVPGLKIIDNFIQTNEELKHELVLKKTSN